jgi:hypothetical protein
VTGVGLSEGIKRLFVLYVRDDPKVAEGNARTLVVLDHKRALAVFFVRSTDFAVDPGVVVNQHPVVKHRDP